MDDLDEDFISERKKTHLQGLPGSRLEDLSNSLTRLCRTLDVTLRSDLLRNSKTLRWWDGTLVHPVEILNSFGVVSQILFACHEDDGETLTEVQDFRDPLEGNQSSSTR
jgi:hypothetical protein